MRARINISNEDLVKAYEELGSSLKVAEKFDIPQATAYRRLVEAGAQITDQKGPRKGSFTGWHGDCNMNKILCLTKGKDTLYFYSGKEAAEYIGCSHPLIYVVAKHRKGCKTARGWSCNWVPLTEWRSILAHETRVELLMRREAAERLKKSV